MEEGVNSYHIGDCIFQRSWNRRVFQDRSRKKIALNRKLIADSYFELPRPPGIVQQQARWAVNRWIERDLELHMAQRAHDVYSLEIR